MSIKLTKGAFIDLSKDGQSLKKVSFGLNWGMITTKKSGFLGLGSSTTKESVDLDSSCATFDENGNFLEKVYFGNLSGCSGAIKHSGDDRSGDSSEDDNDNEVISIDLSKMPSNVKTVFFFLNSYQGHQFDKVPYSRIRVLDETSKSLAEYNLSADSKFSGITTMILGKVVRTGTNWKFTAVGEPSKERDIAGTINEIKKSFL